ncbi:MAG TPA: 6-phosphofructokinase [Dysgonamonadaceae bacterium]|nr:6-phosphofructokinase [Dysgonamonadaceae bacterium]
MYQSIKCIGILTSGGDAPGMNAAIRAVTRTAIYYNIEVKGIYRGYKGLVTGDIVPFKTNSVSNIIQRGGTILKSARCEEFVDAEGRKTAYENLLKHNIDALIVIGGDGTHTGASVFAQEYKDISVVGIPATIDNDLNGTDVTIGYNTALNTIVEAVDKIRDTASSHERLFFIEAMGRNCGALALNSAIAAGAEAAIIPEISVEKDQLHELISQGFRKTKNSSLVLVAESEITGGALKLAERVKEKYPQYDVRVSILGHLQRGGSPTAQDRIWASRMGYAAIQALLESQRNIMIGVRNEEIVYIPFSRAIKKEKPINPDLVKILKVLSI